MKPEELSQLAHLLYPHLAPAEADGLSVQSLAARVKAVRKGLSAEDEFAATVSWLGSCAGIHRIDQAPMPVPQLAERMRAPDFVAFPLVGDQPVPVLIEVKRSQRLQLDWSESYLSSLRRFADLLSLPLLAAWKWRDIWAVVDAGHFSKNVTAYRLTLERALKEDLQCVLFQNPRIQMNPDLELILGMRILDKVSEGQGDVLPDGTYRMQLTHAGFYSKGTEVTGYKGEHFLLFLTAPIEEHFRRTSREDCQQVFRPRPEHGFTLSNVLITQLALQNAHESVDWHTVLSKPFPSSGQRLRDSLQAGIKNGFVRYVLQIVPNTWPAFLPDEEEWRTSRSRT